MVVVPDKKTVRVGPCAAVKWVKEQDEIMCLVADLFPFMLSWDQHLTKVSVAISVSVTVD